MRLGFARTAWFVGVLLVALPGAAIAGGSVVSGPTWTLNPNGTTPLAGVVELETDIPVQVELFVTDGLESFLVQPPTLDTVHTIPVVGMKADRNYTIEVSLVPGGVVGMLNATTAPLPADFPTIVALVSDPALMEPGYTMTNCLNAIAGSTLGRYSIIVDATGEIVWYTTHCMAEAHYLPSGEILYQNGPEAITMDLVGNQTRVTLQFPGLGLHHELIRTPHGTYFSLDRHEIPVDSFFTSETDPAAPFAPATLRDDTVVEFLPDGTLRREWPTYGHMDPDRIGYDSLVPINGAFDWTHGNAVYYRQDDDSLLVSLRSQDTVYKFSRETGEVQWILAPPENWTSQWQPYLFQPQGSPFRWQYHQHAPMWTGPNSFVLYDNGNHRASPFDGVTPVLDENNFSRGVEYEIDENNMKVRQLWEYGENVADTLFTPFIGDCDWMPATNNRLMTYGAVAFVGGVPSPDLGFGVYHARIVEATADPIPVKVFELQAYDPAGGGIIIYRSERIPSLYPLTDYKAPNGVGSTLVVDKAGTAAALGWAASPVDGAHDAAEHYRVYASTMADAGFGMVESTANLDAESDPAGDVLYFKIVAANLGGTSGDEPNP